MGPGLSSMTGHLPVTHPWRNLHIEWRVLRTANESDVLTWNYLSVKANWAVGYLPLTRNNQCKNAN